MTGRPDPFRKATLAWALYDLANTIFAINMTSYHFPVWIVVDQGGTELAYALAFGGSVLVSAVVMPAIGRRADRLGKKAGLIGWTLGSVLLTASLAEVSSLVGALAIFALANFCYQLAGIFYNSMLADVAPSNRLGRVSGLGVALGYGGTLLGIWVTAPIVSQWGRQAAFLPTALLFLIFSLPCFLWVKGGAKHQDRETGARSKTWHPCVENGAGRPMRPFLWACFFGLNAVSTVILFMSVYAKQAIGLTDEALHRFLLTSTGAAIIGSWAWGRLTDRWGSRRTLGWVWACWVAVFGLAASSFDPRLFWFLGGLAGCALGGTWVTSRALIVDLVGPSRVGEAFGWFGLVSRLSAVVGPLVWGLILWLGVPWGAFRYRCGMAAMLVFVIVGWWIYRECQAPYNGIRDESSSL